MKTLVPDVMLSWEAGKLVPSRMASPIIGAVEGLAVMP
jgi:hypothetical protein